MPTKDVDNYTDQERQIMKRFGSSVRCQREVVGLSQEKLAELANVHRTYISGIERGLQNISLLTMIKLAKALTIELDELLSEI